MKIEGIQCDICAKMVSTQTSYLPNNWFTVIQGDEACSSKIFHFCCLDHLRDWIEKQNDVVIHMERGHD